MIASSATVLANLAYLIGAVVLAIVIGLLVWLRHRQPKSVDANMASFRRGLSALAPDAEGGITSLRQAEAARIRPVPGSSSHVRVEPPPRSLRSAGRSSYGYAGDPVDLTAYPHEHEPPDVSDDVREDVPGYLPGNVPENVMEGGQPG